MSRYRCILCCIMLLLPLCRSAEASSVVYTNDAFNYSIAIPASWRTVNINLETKHIMYASPDKKTFIKVKALKSTEEDLDKIARTNTWNLRTIDSRLHSIIETGNISITKNIYGKLLVFQYRSNKGATLQRTLISRNGGIIYIVECKSPLKDFYKFESDFNAAFGNFAYISPNTEREGKEAESPEKTSPPAKKAGPGDESFNETAEP